MKHLSSKAGTIQTVFFFTYFFDLPILLEMVPKGNMKQYGPKREHEANLNHFRR